MPHQANKRIIDDQRAKLGIAPEKVVTTVDRHGNTSAASIPLALAVAVADGRIKRGDLVLLEAMGGGFTWGPRYCAGEWPMQNGLPMQAPLTAPVRPEYRQIIQRDILIAEGGLAMAGKTVTRADLCEAVYQKVGFLAPNRQR